MMNNNSLDNSFLVDNPGRQQIGSFNPITNEGKLVSSFLVLHITIQTYIICVRLERWSIFYNRGRKIDQVRCY